jgi:hypothetical protein
VAQDTSTPQLKGIDIDAMNYGSLEVFDERGNPVTMTFSVAATDSSCGIEDAWGYSENNVKRSLQSLSVKTVDGEIEVHKHHLTDLAYPKQISLATTDTAGVSRIEIIGSEASESYVATFEIGTDCGYSRTVVGVVESEINERLFVRNSEANSWMPTCVSGID